LLLEASIATLAAMDAPPKPIVTPCTQVCEMNVTTGWCYGCHRTREEIAGWRGYSDAAREVIMARLKERAKSAV
jgi:predicted Fe-S protein YdhL (DUF1289 family)